MPPPYFKITDSLELLKKKRNKLAKKYHPDINNSSEATAEMQQIITEYNYYLSLHKRPKIKPISNN